MNNKLGFVLPRIIGAALIAGLGSLVLFMVFKLLLGIAVVGSIAYLVMRGMRHRHGHHHHQQYGMMPSRNEFNRINADSPVPFNRGQMAMNNMQRTSGIVPIN